MQQSFSKQDRILTSNAVNAERDHRNFQDCPSTVVENVRAPIEQSDLNEREEEIKELKDLIEKLQQVIAIVILNYCYII